MTVSLETLTAELDQIYSVPRVVALLKGDLTARAINQDLGVSNTQIYLQNHGFATNSRIRFTVTPGGTLPATTPALLTNQDYYALVVDVDNFEVATQPNGTALVFVNTGVGTIEVVEQAVSPRDSVAVLVNKEVRHPNERRFVLDNLSAAPSPADNDARFPVQQRNFAVAAGEPPYTFAKVLLIRNGDLTVGNTDGDRPELFVLPAPVTIAPGTSQNLNFTIALGQI